MNFPLAGFKRLFRLQGPLLVLIALMFVIYFAQVIFGEAWYEDSMAVAGEIVESWRNLTGGNVSAGDWREFATLISCAFLHGDMAHVSMNMLYLWIFGALLAELLNWRWMLLIFFVSAFGASAVHTILNRHDFIPMLGASGAVMGFEGAYLGLAMRWHLPNPHVWPMSRPIAPSQLALLAVIGVAIDYGSIMSGSDNGIAYGAHVGGFTTGLLFAALVAPMPRLARTRR